jgi:hypothetical protein
MTGVVALNLVELAWAAFMLLAGVCLIVASLAYLTERARKALDDADRDEGWRR